MRIDRQTNERRIYIWTDRRRKERKEGHGDGQRTKTWTKKKVQIKEMDECIEEKMSK